MVLSPAVESVTPDDGSKVTSGDSTPVTVKFDAQMDTSDPDSVVSASGCGAKVKDGSFSDDDSTLSFTLDTNKQETDQTITLTAASTSALASGQSPPGDNDRLDGNQDPSPQNGEAPNDTDYVWHLTCTGSQAPAGPDGNHDGEGPDPPVTVTFTGRWQVDEQALTQAVDQVHGVGTSAGTWRDTWASTLSDFAPASSSTPSPLYLNATTAEYEGTQSEVDTNPSSSCQLKEHVVDATASLAVYPAGGGQWVAAITVPPTPPAFNDPYPPWTVVEGCNGQGPGVGWLGPGSGSLTQPLGHATYSPAISIPDAYLGSAGLTPTEGGSQVQHYRSAVFRLIPESPATTVNFTYTYTYPYTHLTEGEGTIHWDGNVTITVG